VIGYAYSDSEGRDVFMSRSPTARPSVLVVDALVLRRAGVVSFLSSWAHESNIAIIPLDYLGALTQESTPVFGMIVLVIGSQRVADPEPQNWIASLLGKYVNSPLVLISDHEEAAEVVGAFKAGVRAFIPMSAAPDMAAHTLTFIMGGGSFFPPTALLQRSHYDDSRAVVTAPEGGIIDSEEGRVLTVRQQDVLGRLRQGESNKLIGRRLQLRESTVKVHIRHIIRKLGVTNRTQAALSAAQLRLSVRASKHEDDGCEIDQVTGMVDGPTKPALG
jgi:DNA-binding NarL/FixJ family response regulator